MRDLTASVGCLFCASSARGAGLATAMAVAMSLVGCGSVPDATISYYQTKSVVRVTVTRSALCDDANHLYVANTGLPGVFNSADLDQVRTVRLAALRGTFNDSDVKFDLYEDGRLKAVNATQTGEAGAVIKAVTTLATTVGSFAEDGTPKTYPAECAFIKSAGGGKPLAMTFDDVLDLTKTDLQYIKPDAASAPYVDKLKNAPQARPICPLVSQPIQLAVPVKYAPLDGDVLIAVKQPAWVPIKVGVPAIGSPCDSSVWSGNVVVAQLGTEYKLPIPRPAAFGKQSVALAFADSGAITSVQYTNTSGTADLLGVTNSIATYAQPESLAAKAADLKAQADVIAQQQRLLQCKADPTNCK